MTVAYKDIRCGDDMDPYGRDADPIEVLGQDVYHYLITNKFTLLRDPDWGEGIESLLGRPLLSTLAYDVETGIRRAFDGVIDDVTCTVTPVAGEVDSYRMDVRCTVGDEFLELALKLTPDGIVRVS